MGTQLVAGHHCECAEHVCLNSCEHDEPEGKIYGCSKHRMVQVPAPRPQSMLRDRTSILGHSASTVLATWHLFSAFQIKKYTNDATIAIYLQPSTQGLLSTPKAIA